MNVGQVVRVVLVCPQPGVRCSSVAPAVPGPCLRRGHGHRCNVDTGLIDDGDEGWPAGDNRVEPHPRDAVVHLLQQLPEAAVHGHGLGVRLRYPTWHLSLRLQGSKVRRAVISARRDPVSGPTGAIGNCGASEHSQRTSSPGIPREGRGGN